MEKEVEKEVSKSESRRKFIKTAGKFAVYTPLALMLMSKANALECHSPPNNCDTL